MVDPDLLIRDAEALPFHGWDFSEIGDRWKRGNPPWDLRAMIRAQLRPDSTLVDLGTGGGEFLSSLSPLPAVTVATEGYPPNLPVARSRLGPLGVQVVPIQSPDHIPLPDRFATLVLNRHEEFDAREVFRVLRPGGIFLTQQIGGGNYGELDRRFGSTSEGPYNHLETLEALRAEIDGAGLLVQVSREASFPEQFLDVGAVVYFLRAAPWEVPGFTVEKYRGVLLGIHREIEERGCWELQAHRLLIQAQRPR
jgi:SAM-dependent methyltransferase